MGVNWKTNGVKSSFQEVFGAVWSQWPAFIFHFKGWNRSVILIYFKGTVHKKKDGENSQVFWVITVMQHSFEFCCFSRNNWMCYKLRKYFWKKGTPRLSKIALDWAMFSVKLRAYESDNSKANVIFVIFWHFNTTIVNFTKWNVTFKKVSIKSTDNNICTFVFQQK